MSLVVEDRKKRDLNIIPIDLAICLVCEGEMIINIGPRNLVMLDCCRGLPPKVKEKCWS